MIIRKLPINKELISLNIISRKVKKVASIEIIKIIEKVDERPIEEIENYRIVSCDVQNRTLWNDICYIHNINK